MQLTILGSSSALPTSVRNPSAHVLKAHERLYLIDCGEGTQMQLRKNKIRVASINHIFISHLHGDHVFGLYGLLSTFSLMDRKQPLNLYAPGNFITILRSHLHDFDIKLNYEILFVPLNSNSEVVILEDKNIIVSAFPLKHRVPTFGFLFREKPSALKIKKEAIAEYNISVAAIHKIKNGEDFINSDGVIIKNEILTIRPALPLSFAYCSDTKYFKKLASWITGVDLLYHEATFEAGMGRLAATTGHSTTVQAATVASEAQAGKLIIGHFSARYRDTDLLVKEARTIFENTVAASDGTTYEVTHN